MLNSAVPFMHRAIMVQFKRMGSDVSSSEVNSHTRNPSLSVSESSIYSFNFFIFPKSSDKVSHIVPILNNSREILKFVDTAFCTTFASAFRSPSEDGKDLKAGSGTGQGRRDKIIQI